MDAWQPPAPILLADPCIHAEEFEGWAYPPTRDLTYEESDQAVTRAIYLPGIGNFQGFWGGATVHYAGYYIIYVGDILHEIKPVQTRNVSHIDTFPPTATPPDPILPSYHWQFSFTHGWGDAPLLWGDTVHFYNFPPDPTMIASEIEATYFNNWRAFSLPSGQSGEFLDFWGDNDPGFWPWFIATYGQPTSPVLFGLERTVRINVDFYAIVQDTPKGASGIIPLLAALGLMGSFLFSGVMQVNRPGRKRNP